MKQPSRTSPAKRRRTPLASIPKLSSSLVPNSSTFFVRPLTDRFLKSIIDPEDCVSAACRCNMNFSSHLILSHLSFEVEEELGAISSWTRVRSSESAAVTGAGLGFLLGLSWTEMVVPKRECLDDACRATPRLDFSSAWRRRWRFSVGCYIP